MKIYLCISSPAAEFAASELARITSEMGCSPAEIIRDASYANECGMYLGDFSSFPHITPEIPNPTDFDDEIFIETNGECGIIAGSCGRSLLIAVYRYLTELGCRFLTPGKDGEKIPRTELSGTGVSIHEIPSYRHRGVCIEGAVSTENVADMIDFLPKVGMNSYFLQFRESHTFYDRWYSHLYNPELENPGSFSINQAREAISLAAQEMSKRGILYHAVGHGWTCEPFGVPGLGWDEWTAPIPPDAENAFALVNGKRALWGGIPLNTQVCMSNPEVRRKIVLNICEYILEHPTVDMLHFWLGDGCANHCECEECVKMRPSDYYVLMLNELDAELTARGLNSRVVFLIYLDLLWAPEKLKLENPDRFVIMFAPITRSYYKSFKAEGDIPPTDPFVRNAGISALPKEVSKNLSYLREWQTSFHGSGFDFDYHYMWSHLRDGGGINIARILSEDICNLKNIGLDGFISCQLGRAAFPNALGLTVMGRTLWDRNCDFDTLCKEYFDDCYGPEMGPVVLKYLTKLSEMFRSLELEGKMSQLREMPDRKKKHRICNDIVNHISNFTVTYFRHTNENIFFTWLMEHAWIYSDYANLLSSTFDSDNPESLKHIKYYIIEMTNKLFAREYMYQGIFDVWEFVHTMNNDFKSYFENL